MEASSQEGQNQSSVTYPYLPEGRVFLYVSSDNPFMTEAEKTARESSTDARHPTGAVLVRDGVIIERHANQSALKNKKLIELHKNGWCVRIKLGVKSGTKYWLCPGCSTHKDHAESGLIIKATKKGIDTKGADVYLWGHWWCCKPCWDNMIAGGVRNVYVLENSHILFARK